MRKKDKATNLSMDAFFSVIFVSMFIFVSINSFTTNTPHIVNLLTLI